MLYMVSVIESEQIEGRREAGPALCSGEIRIYRAQCHLSGPSRASLQASVGPEHH